jgi:membrane protease YdiL (CAAX protease family)
MVYGQIVGSFASSNDNQQAAVELMGRFPIFGFFIVSIVGPILEEITYRLGLFSLGAKYKKWLGYVLSIVFFALIHINFVSKDIVAELINLPTYMVCGVVLGLAYDKFGFATSVTAHITNNLIGFFTTFVSTLTSK